jgi:UDP-glucose 4-epimerase
MDCLVTGGAGFIGSHLTDALVHAGHTVTVVDDLSTGRCGQVNPAARFVQASVLDTGLAEVFQAGAFAAVFHLAAQTDVVTSVAEPDRDAEVNVIGGIKVLELCRRFGVRKVIYSSSSAVFGEPVYLPMDEKHPIRPLCPYAASKHTLEHYLEIYRSIHGVHYTVLRYANAYGPRQDPHHEGGVVAIFAYRLLNGQPAVIYGDGEQTRDFVHVDDLVGANLACLLGGDDESLNLGTGREVTVNQLFALLMEAAGVEAEARYQPERRGEMRRLSLHSARAAQALRWTPRVGLEAGLQTVVDHFRRSSDG